jgi:hypothetical protein
VKFAKSIESGALVSKSILSLAILFGVSACSTAYESTALKSWDEVADGNHEAVLKDYEKRVVEPIDRLLLILDQAMVLRSARRFKESNEKLFEASRLFEISGYVSVSEQAASLLTNERMTVYQGEEFERVLVHLYLALNFVSLGDSQAALVEARKVNESLHLLSSQKKRSHHLNAFARYLTGFIYEKSREWNDAYIAYKASWSIAGEPRWEFLGRSLIQNALRLGFEDDLSFWTKTFGEDLVSEVRSQSREAQASAVLFLEARKSPKKISTQEKHRARGQEGGLIDVIVPVAVFEKRSSRVDHAQLCAEMGSGERRCAKSYELFSLEETAITDLKSRMARQVSKAVASAAAKVGVAAAAGKASDSDAVGLLTALVLFSSSQADTRSWLLLPGSFQAARLDLAPGAYPFFIEIWSASRKIHEESLGVYHLKARELGAFQWRVWE